MGINSRLLEIISNLEYPTVVEVGVAQAEGALRILSLGNVRQYIGVDPWLRYEESPATEFSHGYLDRKMGLWSSQNEWDVVYERAKERIRPYSHKAKLIRAFSHEARDQIDTDVDVVYLDGNHQYEYVLKDLELWYEKLVPGGLLCGDDYHFSGGEMIAGKWGGRAASMVAKAVEDFCQIRSLEHDVVGDDFLIWKPKN